MPNYLVAPWNDCVLSPQTVESSFDWDLLNIRFPVFSPRILCFVPGCIFKPLLPGHPRGGQLTLEGSQFTVRRSAKRNQQVVRCQLH